MSGLGSRDLERLTSELVSFVRSGVPVPAGLAQLEGTLPRGDLKSLTDHLARSTAAGVPLSEALGSAPVSVPAEYEALVRCGEISGDMGSILKFALEHGRRVKRHRGALSTMFIYPLLVLIVLMIIVVFALVFLLPQFRDIYNQLGAQLPGMTQVVLGLADFVVAGPGAILAALVLAGLIYLLVLACQDRLPAWLTTRLAGVNSLSSLSDTAVMTEFLGNLVDRGVPMPEACRAASLVVYQPDMRQSMERMARAAEQGHATADQLSREVPATAAWLYRQGEARGTVGETCRNIAEYCESRFELLSRRTLYVLEPVFIFAVSLMCGLVLLSLYLPLFNIPKLIGSE